MGSSKSMKSTQKSGSKNPQVGMAGPKKGSNKGGKGY